MRSSRFILITGMPGSGKTTLAEYFKDSGYNVVTMGDVVRETAFNMGIEPSRANLGRIAEELRIRQGKEAIARICVEKIASKGLERVVIDGIRSLDEVEVFSENKDTVLIAVHASPKTRFLRLSTRGRSDDAAEKEVFRQRDIRELGLGLGNAIAMADQILINEGAFDEFKTAFEELVGRLNENR